MEPPHLTGNIASADQAVHQQALAKCTSIAMTGTIDIRSLPIDPNMAVIELCDLLLRDIEQFYFKGRVRPEKLRELKHRLDLILVAIEASDVPPDFKQSYRNNIRAAILDNESLDAIAAYISDVSYRLKALELETKFAEQRKHAILFKLKDSDLRHLVTRVAEMRDFVTKSAFLDSGHKNRILKRIDSLAFELTKERGNFDVILGAVVEIGEAVGIFGKKVKPLADRIAEIRGTAERSIEPDAPSPGQRKQLPTEPRKRLPADHRKRLPAPKK